MGYAEAIEQQMEMYSFYASAHGQGMMARMMAQPWARKGKGFDGNADLLQQIVVVGIGAGNPFYVAPSICSTLTVGATSFPLPHRLVPERVPVWNAFIWFGEPLVLPEMDDGPAKPLRALLWAPAAQSADGKRRIAPIENPSRLSVVTFHDVNWCPVPVVAHWMNIPLDGLTADDEQLTGMEPSPRRAASMRYLFTLLEFIDQRLLSVSSRPILNNTVRRRLAKAYGHEPSVRVVELRQREYQQREESHDRNTEYSCQWLVRGHWHQYHTRDGLQPRWVSPYVKGPTDKPLKAPTITAYEVVR